MAALLKPQELLAPGNLSHRNSAKTRNGPKIATPSYS